jgi:hypothetical protein
MTNLHLWHTTKRAVLLLLSSAERVKEYVVGREIIHFQIMQTSQSVPSDLWYLSFLLKHESSFIHNKLV